MLFDLLEPLLLLVLQFLFKTRLSKGPSNNPLREYRIAEQSFGANIPHVYSD